MSPKPKPKAKAKAKTTTKAKPSGTTTTKASGTFKKVWATTYCEKRDGDWAVWELQSATWIQEEKSLKKYGHGKHSERWCVSALEGCASVGHKLHQLCISWALHGLAVTKVHMGL